MADGLTITDATLLVDSQCTLGEGIIWWPARGGLLWTDIEERRLWMHVPGEGVTCHWGMPDRLGCMALAESGSLLLGLAKGLFVSSEPPRVTKLADVEIDSPTRVNDGRADRAGNLVFGTMDLEKKHPTGSFYQYSRRHGLRRLELGGVVIANSICFSPDGGTMYFCDSPRRQIMQCSYDAGAARVSNVRVFAEVGTGFPDGSIVDSEGCLWNAEWGSGVVRRYTVDGHLDREVRLSAPQPSCVAFGSAGLEVLYVTTAREDLSPDELAAAPHSGGVFAHLAPGVRGLPDKPIADL